MPFEQLRALVVSLVEPDRAAPSARPDTEREDPVAEFDTRPTTCLPGPRTSTLDQLIAALQQPPSILGRPAQPRRRAPRR
jgi:hypothetical protein